MGIAKCASAEGGTAKVLPVKAGSGRRDRLRGALYQFIEMIDTLNRMEPQQQRGEERSKKSAKGEGMWARFRKTNLAELNLSNLEPTDYFGMVRPILDYPEGLPIVEEWAEERAKTSQYKAELARSFWTLDLADLHVPEKLYEDEGQRFKRCVTHWENCLDSRKGNRMKRDQKYKAEKELDRFVSVRKLLAEELDDGKAREKSVAKELSTRAMKLGGGILEESTKTRVEVMKEFATECIIPRARASGADAMFCVRFIFGINKMNKSGAILDVPELIKYLILSTQNILEEATECDADNFAVLISELLTMMDAWRSNKKAFDGDSDRHGFRSSEGHIWRHEVYCNYAFELHQKLAIGCQNLLKSTEYLHVRNGLTLLHLVAEMFPKVREHATPIIEAVKKVTKSEKEDLKLSATRVLGTLKNGEAKRVPVHVFKLKPKKSSDNEGSRGVKREREDTSRQGDNNNNQAAKRMKSPKSPVSPSNNRKQNSKRPRTPEESNSNHAASKRPRSEKREEKENDGRRHGRSPGDNSISDKRRHSNENRDGRDGGRDVRGRVGRDGVKDGERRDRRRDGPREGGREREGGRNGPREGGRSSPRDGGGGRGRDGGGSGDRDTNRNVERNDRNREENRGGGAHSMRDFGRDVGPRDARHGRVTDRLGRVGGGREREQRERIPQARETRFREDDRRAPWNQERPNRNSRSPPRRSGDFEDDRRRHPNMRLNNRMDEPLRTRDDRIDHRHERIDHRNERNDRNDRRRNDQRNRGGWNDNGNQQYDERFDVGFDHRRQPQQRRRRGGQDRRR